MKNNDIVVIADTQVTPTSPTKHIHALARYIWKHKPSCLVHIGDHWDFPSLNYYANKIEMEGARLVDDLIAGAQSLDIFKNHIEEMNVKAKKQKKKTYSPDMHFITGNHERRLERTIESNPYLYGIVDLEEMVNKAGFKLHKFLDPYWRDDVAFIHYLPAPESTRAIGGSIENKLNKTNHSFVHGHQQKHQYARRQNMRGTPHFGVVAGSFYMHDESYRGPAGNTEIRGFVHLKSFTNRFRYKDFDCDFVSLERLLEKY